MRSVKRCLRKIIGCASLSLDELLTAVIEVEAVVNSQPLTYVSSDDINFSVNQNAELALSLLGSGEL